MVNVSIVAADDKERYQKFCLFFLVNKSIWTHFGICPKPGKFHGRIKAPKDLQSQVEIDNKLEQAEKMQVTLKPSAGAVPKLTASQAVDIYENILKNFGKIE